MDIKDGQLGVNTNIIIKMIEGCKAWRTKERHRQAIGQIITLCPFLTERHIADIEANEVYIILDSIQGKDNLVSTKQKLKESVIRLLRVAKSELLRNNEVTRAMRLSQMIDLATEYDRFTSKRSNHEIISIKTSLEMNNYLNAYGSAQGRHAERNYLIVLMLACTGMRTTGITSIRLCDIDSAHCLVHNQEKETLYHGKNTYFFPEPVLPLLRYFLTLYDIRDPDERVFATTEKSIRLIAKTFDAAWKPRFFRKNINDLWALTGVPEILRCRFLNQVPRSVNEKHYLPLYTDPRFLMVHYHHYFPYKSHFPNYDWNQWDEKLKNLKREILE